MNNRPIGILDSGVGGLSIWEKVASELPHESTIYIADSQNIPYGNKTQAQIYFFAKKMIEFLVKQNVKLIILACNTVTVSHLSKLREDFQSMPIIGIVPVVKTAAQLTRNKKIGILSTPTTAKSRYQKKLIADFADGCEVVNKGTNLLVPFVEKGQVNGKEVKAVLMKELADFKKKGVDTIAIGCSHFPFLKETIREIMGKDLLILDSSSAIARQTGRVLANNHDLSESANPVHRFYTTGDSNQFNKAAKILLKKNNVKAEKIFLHADFKDKKIAVVGFGMEGFSSAQFLTRKGARVTILDRKQESKFEKELLTKAKNLGASFVFGKDCLADLNSFDVIVRSPGVKRGLKEFALAEKKGVLITSETKLFFELCPARVIGVTGTKGKGTTSTLIYKMLKAQGLDVYLGGNIGNPPFEFLEQLTPKSWVVLELSSFQLIDLTQSPHIAVMLMTTSEHLDYHKDVYEYINAKRNILRFQKVDDFAVINKDYPASNESDILTEAKVFKVSKESEIKEGCFVKNDRIIMEKDGLITEIIDTDEILLLGKHNLENVCAATIAASLAGVSKENMIKVLKNFQGLEHRLELVREIKGVRYYDDSFSTTPETTIAAIEAFDDPEILILGGSGKRSDFLELGEIIRKAKNIKIIIGIGEEWSRMKEQFRLENVGIAAIEGAKNMSQVVLAASKVADPGDVVLLSPACASFDMFKNYKDRGEQFKKAVMQLSF